MNEYFEPDGWDEDEPPDEREQRRPVVHELAGAFFGSGSRTVDELAVVGAACFERWPRWMEALALRIATVHRFPLRLSDLVELIDDFLAGVPADALPQLARLVPRPQTRPRPGPRSSGAEPRPALEHTWPIVRVPSLEALAEVLELSDGQLAWLADVRGLERSVTAEKLRNYRYRVVPRPGGLPRVIEILKGRLKEIQHWVLRSILDHVPVHSAAHAFRRGNSAVSHARQHAGRAVVLRLDLKDFFPSVFAGRIYGIFRTIGYPPPVAHALTGLTTNVVPSHVWQTIPPASDPDRIAVHFWLGRQLATPHLPQGAPTSPALANLAAFALDRRLDGLARKHGFRYSRYADDLTFSSARAHGRELSLLRARTTQIAALEGFRVNPRKTMTRTAASRQSVCGIVVNAHPNIARAEYDQLKAILHNCAVDGPESQNRDGHPDFAAHLRGRIAWVASVNPARAAKLQQRFAAIAWN